MHWSRVDWSGLDCGLVQHDVFFSFTFFMSVDPGLAFASTAAIAAVLFLIASKVELYGEVGDGVVYLSGSCLNSNNAHDWWMKTWREIDRDRERESER